MNWVLLQNSLLVSGLATLLAVGFGAVASLWVMGLPRFWRSLFLGAAILALALPPFLVTNSWLDYLGPAGLWHRWLPFNIMTLGGAAWILGLSLWPLSLLALSSAWRRLEPSQLECDMAVMGWVLIRGLLLPLARSVLVFAAVLTFVLALNNFAVPAILQVKVFPAEMWVQFNTTFDSWGALRLSWPLVAAPLLLLACFGRRAFPWPHLQAPVPAWLFRQQLGPAWFWGCGAATLLACLLSAALPLVQIFSARRTWTELPGALAAGQNAVWNSFWFAAASATLVLGLGLVGAGMFRGEVRGARCAKGSGRSVLGLSSALLWLPFLIPGVVMGVGLIKVFNHAYTALFYQSAGIVILAYVIRYLALGWHGVAHAVQASDPDLADIARLEGAGRWQRLRVVYWPQIAPQLSAAWYIIFLLCLWDVESMVLVWPPTGETLALRIFNLLHYGHNAQVNALCLTLLLLALLPLLGWKAWDGVRGACAVVRGPARKRQSAARLMVLLACALGLQGCAPPSSNSAPLDSQIFSRAVCLGTRGAGIGQFSQPRSVAVDKLDDLFVVDMTGRVQKFSPAGKFLLLWQMPQLTQGKPKGMCHDRDGNIYVLEPHYQRLNLFTPQGKLLAQWGQKGTNNGQFYLPRSVAVDSKGEIFVSEYGVTERIQKFACANGSHIPHWVASFGRPGTAPGELNRAEGICFDAQDRLYVADSCNHRIEVFTSDGKFLRTYGHPGTGKGELSYPYDICVDAQGRQYVAEYGNGRIQVFDAHDQPIEIIGCRGGAPGQFNDPWSLALDSKGDLYVADSQNHRVQELIRR